MSYNIKEIRLKRGYTQDELSKKSNVSRAIISKLESNSKVSTSTGTLKKLAESLDVTVSDLFF